jgi:CMP-N,N'-diacetyllegionaminic acid synthase
MKGKKGIKKPSKRREMKALCIIPARSGSKSLPHKNIKPFNGKPMMCWSIEQALKLKEIFEKEVDIRVIVSTDSEDYKKIAEQAEAEVPFLRPLEISGDSSTDLECFEHVLKELYRTEKYKPDFLIHLRPTYPTRKIDILKAAIEMFLKLEGYDSLRSVIRTEKSPYKMYRVKGRVLEPLFCSVDGLTEPYNRARQELPECFLHNGYVDILRRECITEKYSMTGDRIFPFLMEEQEVNDIDTEEDFLFSEAKQKDGYTIE